jgi:predicted RNase H-like HicB family nuclease
MKVTIQLKQNENGEFVARCTSLPGCVSRARSRREAKQKIDKAIRGYVAAVNNFEPEHLDEEVLEV